MGLKQKISYLLIHKNQNIEKEFNKYSLKMKHDKIKKIKEKDSLSNPTLWNTKLSLIEQGKRVFALGLLNLHYRIFRKKTPFYKIKISFDVISESETYMRWKNIHLAISNLQKYDVISFDIFDTLILRPFESPKDLFMIVGNRLNQINFKTIRENAEKIAREKMQKKEGHREVTIYDIYEEVNKETGIDIDYGVKTEFQVEKDFCFANPYMLQTFKILKSMGKKIVITSDMYIPHDLMVELLEHCGYTGYEKLYVSCDYKTSKRFGGLYDAVLSDGSDKKIIHIGDNWDSDIKSAESKNIKTFFYENCHKIGAPYRAEGMSELVGSLYSGIVNTHLHNGTKIYSLYYEYGFVYGGLYVVGFCNWIHKKAKEQGVQKILFLARDGDIYSKVFNRMFNDIPNEYVYWSNTANSCEKEFREIVGGNKKIAVVDTNCIESDLLNIKEFVEEKWKIDCEVKCYFAKEFKKSKSKNISCNFNNKVDSYVPLYIKNCNMYAKQAHKNNYKKHIYFEMFKNAFQTVFTGFDESGGYSFNLTKVKNLTITKEMQKGINDFINEYLKFSNKDESIRDVSSKDLYLLERFAISDKSFINDLTK